MTSSAEPPREPSQEPQPATGVESRVARLGGVSYLHIPALNLSFTLRSRARHQYIANQLLPSFWEGAAAITNGPAGDCIVESSRQG